MSEFVQQYVATAAQGFSSGAGWLLADSLPFDPSHSWFMPLHQALQQVHESSLSPQSLQIDPTVAPFVSAVLRNVKAVRDDSPESARRAFRDMVNIHSELQKLYETQDSEGYTNAYLSPIVLTICKRVASLSHTAASLSSEPIRSPDSARSIRDIARQALERTLRICDSRDDDPRGDFAVGDFLHALANILWRMYAQRHLHTQAAELDKRFRGLQPSEEVRLEQRGDYISAAVVAESYYWRGRLGVVLLDFRTAAWWLDKAWRLAPVDAWKQRRSILVRLVPVQLLLGKLPLPGVLETYGLAEAYAPFITAFKNGDVPGWRRLLAERREWLRARNVWLLWFERGEILVWRNLFRHALRHYYATVPSAAPPRCPTWVFVAAAQQAFAGSGELEEGTIILEDIICVLSSLIDQSLVLGILSYSQKTLAMKPRPDGMGGFPALSTVKPRKVPGIA